MTAFLRLSFFKTRLPSDLLKAAGKPRLVMLKCRFPESPCAGMESGAVAITTELSLLFYLRCGKGVLGQMS
jgi:hypothetical protein